MRKHVTYTSTLSPAILKELELYAVKLKTTKKLLIEKAITSFLEELKRQEYVRSFQNANADKEMLLIAEEGITEYKKMLDK